MDPTTETPAVIERPFNRAALNARLARIEADPLVLPYEAGNNEPGLIMAANDSLFTEGFFSEPLTAYAIGWRDGQDLDAACEFYAPSVPTSRRFEYAEFLNAEEFYSDDDDDDARPLMGDFKTTEIRSKKTLGKTLNRGLRVVVDADNAPSNWQQLATGRLMRRLKRNRLRRAIALLSAAAVNTAKTWDTTAGKDPDQDVTSELVTAASVSGVAPNRIGYGDTAWSKRLLAHRAQNNAGGYASAGLTPEQLAGFLGVDQVMRSRERYQSTASAKSEIVGNLVLMFQAQAGAGLDDPSNIKSFTSDAGPGMKFRVYVRQIATKLWEVVVECYESTKITSTLGIRKFTVS